MSTTRTSSAMATSILRMFSAWCSSGAPHVDLAELGDPVDELRDLVTELLAHLVPRDLGVLDGVVQERGHERFRVQAEIGEDARHRQGMLDVRLAGEPRLAGVRAIGDIEGTPYRGPILRREVLDTGHEVGDGHGLYQCRAGARGSNTM